ncbi:hypothetical protein Tco_1145459 [Tanacetum coccineum]
MLMGKWTSMNREVGRFNSLVNETNVLRGDNDDDWKTRVEMLYRSVAGLDFKQKSAWLFMKDKHKWKNPDSTNARRNQGLVTEEEPELFGDDELPRPPDKQRIAKSQQSSNSTASSGPNLTMFQEILQQQYTLDREEKMEHLNRETSTRVELINSQRRYEDLKVNGSILTPCKVGGPFLPLVEPEANSIGLSTSQPPPYIVKNDIETHNPWKMESDETQVVKTRVMAQEKVVQENEDLVQDEEDLVEEEEDLF